MIAMCEPAEMGRIVVTLSIHSLTHSLTHLFSDDDGDVRTGRVGAHRGDAFDALQSRFHILRWTMRLGFSTRQVKHLQET